MSESDLSVTLTSPEMVAAVARALAVAQSEGRVEYRRRVGYAGRMTMARCALDAICKELDVPDSIDLLLADVSPPDPGAPS